MVTAIFGLLGVIVGGLIAVLKELHFKKMKDEKDAKYLSALVSFELERYASLCADVVGDNGLCQGQPDERGYSRTQVNLPKFEPLLIKGEWTTLPTDLMFEILDLPQKAEAADNKIDGVFENDSPPDWSYGFEERQLQYANLGIKALMLSEKLKLHAGFPNGTDNRWTPLNFMVERLTEIEKNRFEASQRVLAKPLVT